MSDWKTKIAGCFGVVDKIFAGHQNEEDRAFELLKTLRSENIRWSQLETATREYLKNTPTEHTEKQIKKLSSAMKFWIEN